MKILSESTGKYSIEEVKLIREYLYALAEIEVDNNKNNNIKITNYECNNL